MDVLGDSEGELLLLIRRGLMVQIGETSWNQLSSSALYAELKPSPINTDDSSPKNSTNSGKCSSSGANTSNLGKRSMIIRINDTDTDKSKKLFKREK